MNSKKHFKNTSKGFTLIELIITVVAIGIFGSITANILANASKIYSETLKKQKFVSEARSSFFQLNRNLSLQTWPTNDNIINSKTILGKLKIKSNAVRKIDSYIFKGYEKFPKKFVEKFLRIKIGEKLDIKKLKNSSNYINSLQFVRQIKDPEILFTKDSTFISIIQDILYYPT